MSPEKNNNGAIQSRLGRKFHEEIEKIKDARLRSGKSKDRPSTEKITNMVVRHKDSWGDIAKDIIEASEEELNKYGN